MTVTQSAPTLEPILLATGTTVVEITAEDKARLIQVIGQFDSGIQCTAENTEAMRIIAGNINMTYGLLHLESGLKFIIQRMNTIFDIGAIDNNLQQLEAAQAKSTEALPSHWQEVGYLNVAGSRSKIFYNADESAWRIMRFVPGEIKIFNSFNEVPAEMRESVARSQGEAIATFGRMLEAAPADAWQQPLPNFHNARYHLEYFKAILRGETIRLSLSRDASRQVTLRQDIMAKYRDRIEALVAKIQQREALVSVLDSLGQIVAHGDTKINNFVFCPDAEGTLRCVCLIDLDTVQPGNMLDDLGDALRFSNPAGEEPADIDTVTIDETVFHQIIEGYLTAIKSFHGPEREQQLRRHVVNASKQYMYIQSIRFFADGLVGSKYFKPKPGHHDDINLYRGEVQMRALEALEQIDF